MKKLQMGGILKEGLLTKRAIGKSVIKTFSLKDRWFVLTENSLAYYVDQQKGKEKGRLEMRNVRAVENVDGSAFKREFGFQILFDDVPLYVFAQDEVVREEWIYLLRKVIRDRSRKDSSSLPLMRKYHEGVYIDNIWSCCKERLKAFPGCKSTFIENFDEPDNKAAGKASTFDTTIEEETNGSNFIVTAKYDFSPVQETDLELIKDQEYTVLNATQDKNWWFARDSLGREGYIPSNYVRKHEGIQSEKWYHGAMSRQEADNALAGCADGTFVVHDSRRPAMYTLSFSCSDEVKHYHIKLDQYGKYYVSQRHHFDSIAELIEYHKLNAAGLVTRLRFAYSGSGKAPVTLGHGIFSIPEGELEIQSKIGQGQFGTVHQAIWKGRDRVAVKMMKEDAMNEHELIEEAKLMQRFKHKNLVQMYGISHSSSRPLCLVVELMQNGSLLNYLKTSKSKLNQDHLLGIIFQVSSAMMYLEGEKFIHRDLAARNCLVGFNNVIKVADFGLARYTLDNEYTASEGTKFPIRWAAPEVIDYTRFSSRSDVWAFGVLGWEVYSWGLMPYTSRTNTKIVEDIRNGIRLSKPSDCPYDIFQLLSACWDHSPELRPTFKEIYQILASHAEDYDDT